MSYKNEEGYSDPTAGKAIRAAGLLGLEITGIRDRKTGKEWKKP